MGVGGGDGGGTGSFAEKFALSLVAGGGAGAISKTCIAPLERVCVCSSSLALVLLRPPREPSFLLATFDVSLPQKIPTCFRIWVSSVAQHLYGKERMLSSAPLPRLV